MEHILSIVGLWIQHWVGALGYYGVVLMMGIESACIPLPSEVIMPFGGYLVFKNPTTFTILGMGVAGAIGCVWGSVLAYCVGMWGGRPFVEKYGKYVFIKHKDLDTADRFFAKYGSAAIFVSRLLPVVRTFISFPAGVARTNFTKFLLYTFLGSLPWCYALACVGYHLGAKWENIKTYFHGADVVIGVVIVVGLAFYIYHHIKPEKPHKKG